ncbi:MAG: hypothetical protein HY253_08025 [Burkholderiales bacterium]|nr:hypothetical protein [Burkholderiales bacterium]
MRYKHRKQQQKETTSQARQGSRLKRTVVLAGVTLLAGTLMYRAASFDDGEHPRTQSQLPTSPSSDGISKKTIAFSPLLPSATEQRTHLVRQLEEVDQTLCTYEESSKYPLSSRPAAEHLDQLYPNQTVSESHAMRKKNGGVDADIQIESGQSRVYMAARESVLLSLRAYDQAHQPQTVFVTQAIARGLSFDNKRNATQVALAMADTGRDGDEQANDGIVSARFSPAATGLAQFHGTIRIEVNFTVNGQAGMAFFDVIYSPDLPATWAGKIREANEAGALVFYLPLQVHRPGRYLVNARLDDASGAPFAFLNFNELLPQGLTEVKLIAAGNLLRDKEASFPLKLRDIDGFLLKEDSDPDRELIPRIEGIAYQSKQYNLKAFSDAEWSGEERQRHLNEFRKDVALAKEALVAFDPDQARRPFPQSACSKARTSFK